MQKIHEEYKDRGAVVLAVSGESAATVRNYFGKEKYTFLSLREKGRKISKAYRVTDLPVNYVIGPDGKVAARSQTFGLPGLRPTLDRLTAGALPPEELLKRVEEKLVKAKSGHWKAKITLQMGALEEELSAEGWFKDGKFRYAIEGEFSGNEMKQSLVCDGKTLSVQSTQEEGPSTTSRDAPEGLDASLRTLIVRAGAALPMMLAAGDGKEGGDPKDLVAVKDAKHGQEEKVGDRAARVIEYSASLKGENMTVRLWLDAETLLPLKRTLSGTGGATFSESYSDVQLDGDVPDDVFAPPRKKEK